MALTIKDTRAGSVGAADLTLTAFSTNPAVGDVIVVYYAEFGGTGIAPTDSQGNTYTEIALSGGGSTKVHMWYAKVTTAGSTQVTCKKGTWTHAAGQAWLLTGSFSTTPYNSDVFTQFATTTSALFGPTSLAQVYPGSIFLVGVSIGGTNDVGDPTGYNTEGVNGFTAAMHGADRSKKLDWSAHEDILTAYKLSSSGAAESGSFPNSTGGQQWATVIASFAPPRVPIITSIAGPNPSATEFQTIGGETMTITGTTGTFSSSWVTGVTVGGVAATNVVVVNSSTITCTTPAGSAGTQAVIVTGSEGNSASSNVTYTVRPTVTGISPQFAYNPAAGTAVTITGTGFQSGATVTFNGVSATSVVVVNTTTITCNVPAGASGACVVAVTNP